MATSEPTFIFFPGYRDLPKVLAGLASSMQSFETVLLLIALKRYPHALITCVGAIESTIKSPSTGLQLRENAPLVEAISVARKKSPQLAAFPEDLLNNLRKERNRITHSGFSPKDNSESVGLLAEAGFPFLRQCYRYLHSFDLWDVLPRPVVDQLEIGTSVLQHAKGVKGLDRSYCLKSLGHFVQWTLKPTFTSDWEWAELIGAEQTGRNFERKLQDREKLERLFGEPNWTFDCPICDSIGDAVCQLDDDELRSRNIVPTQMACVNCGFVVGEAEPFLSEALLTKSCKDGKQKILNEYGMK